MLKFTGILRVGEGYFLEYTEFNKPSPDPVTKTMGLIFATDELLLKAAPLVSDRVCVIGSYLQPGVYVFTVTEIERA